MLVGNLGADPEIKTTNSGMQIGNLRLATTERKKDKDGNWTDHTEWHRVTCFDRTAENVGKFTRKGSQLYIEGRIQTRKYQDKDGQDRYSTEIVADIVKFLGSKADGASAGASAGASFAPSTSAPSRRQPDDDIPF